MELSNERKIELFDGMFDFVTSRLVPTYEEAIDNMDYCGFTEKEIKQYIVEQEHTKKEADKMIKRYKEDDEFYI